MYAGLEVIAEAETEQRRYDRNCGLFLRFNLLIDKGENISSMHSFTAIQIGWVHSLTMSRSVGIE